MTVQMDSQEVSVTPTTNPVKEVGAKSWAYNCTAIVTMKQPRMRFAVAALLAAWTLPAPAAKVFYQGNSELWWESSS